MLTRFLLGALFVCCVAVSSQAAEVQPVQKRPAKGTAPLILWDEAGMEATKCLKDKGIDIGDHYLSSITFDPDGNADEPESVQTARQQHGRHWQVVWETPRYKSGTGQILAWIYEDKYCETTLNIR